MGECLAGYYCAGSNTGNKGETADAPAEKKCAKGFFCPLGSTSAKGAPGTRPADTTCKTSGLKDCPCAAGYYCKEGSETQFGEVVGSTVKTECEAGYYCKEGSETQFGEVVGSTVKTKCEAQYFCPAGSTTGHGEPAADYTAPVTGRKCLEGTECTCLGGFKCPAASTTGKGKMAAQQTDTDADKAGADCTAGFECPCKQGYICWSKEDSRTLFGTPQKCPPGFYCEASTIPTPMTTPLPCQSGKYCPQTSTQPTGNPLEAGTSGCAFGNACDCSAGFFCPPQSTTNKGTPKDLRGNAFQWSQAHTGCSDIQSCTCDSADGLGTCSCPRGYYCEAGTNIPAKCPAGRYCEKEAQTASGTGPCKAGFWCPATSSADEGGPMADEVALGTEEERPLCTANRPCKCPAVPDPGSSRCYEKKVPPALQWEPGRGCGGSKIGTAFDVVKTTCIANCRSTPTCKCAEHEELIEGIGFFDECYLTTGLTTVVAARPASKAVLMLAACPTNADYTCKGDQCARMVTTALHCATEKPAGSTVDTDTGRCVKVTMNAATGNTNSKLCHVTQAARRGRSLSDANFRRIVPAAQQGDTHQQMLDLTPGAAEYVARMRQRRSHNQSPARYEGRSPDPSAIGSCMKSYETHFDLGTDLEPHGPMNRPFPTGRTAVLDAAFHYAERRYRRRLSRRRARRDVAEKGAEYTGGTEEGGSGMDGQFIDDPEVEEIEEAAEAVHVTDYYEKLQDKDDSDVGWYADSNANPTVNEGDDAADEADEADHVIRHYIDGVAYGGIINQTAVAEAALARALKEETDLTRATGEAGKNAADRAAQERQLQQVAAASSAAGSQDANVSTSHLHTSAQRSGLVGATPVQNRPAAWRRQESATPVSETPEEEVRAPRVETLSGEAHKEEPKDGGGAHAGVGQDTQLPKRGSHSVPGQRGEWAQMPEREAAALKEKMIASGALDSMMDTLATQKPVSVSATNHVPRAMPPSRPSPRQRRKVGETRSGAGSIADPEPAFTMWFIPKDMTTVSGLSLSLSLPSNWFPLASITFGISSNDFYCQEDFDDPWQFEAKHKGFLAGLFGTIPKNGRHEENKQFSSNLVTGITFSFAKIGDTYPWMQEHSFRAYWHEKLGRRARHRRSVRTRDDAYNFFAGMGFGFSIDAGWNNAYAYASVTPVSGHEGKRRYVASFAVWRTSGVSRCTC